MRKCFCKKKIIESGSTSPRTLCDLFVCDDDSEIKHSEASSRFGNTVYTVTTSVETCLAVINESIYMHYGTLCVQPVIIQGPQSLFSNYPA